MLDLLDRTVLIFSLAAILSLGLGSWVWIRSRARGPRRAVRAVAVVSPEEAAAPLYPYVFVSDTGSARELHACEKQFLETPFPAGDAARPYVKSSYGQTNSRGTLSGYCRRAVVPRGVRIGYPPIELPLQTRPAAAGMPNRAPAAQINGSAAELNVAHHAP